MIMPQYVHALEKMITGTEGFELLGSYGESAGSDCSDSTDET